MNHMKRSLDVEKRDSPSTLISDLEERGEPCIVLYSDLIARKKVVRLAVWKLYLRDFWLPAVWAQWWGRAQQAFKWVSVNLSSRACLCYPLRIIILEYHCRVNPCTPDQESFFCAGNRRLLGNRSCLSSLYTPPSLNARWKEMVSWSFLGS